MHTETTETTSWCHQGDSVEQPYNEATDISYSVEWEESWNDEWCECAMTFSDHETAMRHYEFLRGLGFAVVMYFNDDVTLPAWCDERQARVWLPEVNE